MCRILEIGEIAGAAEVTVKQTYKLLQPRAAELFPDDFKYGAEMDPLPWFLNFHFHFLFMKVAGKLL